jgi:alpha-tubulin suppressor-like RCC1 family protein
MKAHFKNSFRMAALTAGLSLIPASHVMAQIFSAQPVTSIAAGGVHSLFTKSDGSLWGMGANSEGQLGLGSALAKTNVPQEIISSGAGTIAAGYFHSLYAVGGSLWGMGDNSYGDLGDGTTTTRYVPEQIVSIFRGGIAPIAGGGNHSLFGTYGVISLPTFRAMGLNNDGQLGDGTTVNQTSPETISSSRPLAVACGESHSLYLTSDGSVWAMGDNTYGQLGDNTFSQQDSPENISALGGPTNVIAIAAGFFHSVFVDSNGNLWGVGSQDEGQFGDTGYPPFDVPALFVVGGVTSVAAGYYHTVFIRNGALWGMGYNNYGQLGDGTTNTRNAFQIVASNVVAVACGGYHTLFIKSDGSLWGMGRNTEGELGTGDYTNHYTPVEIISPPQPTITGINFSGTNVILTWPTNAVGFNLQSATSLVPPVTWNGVSTGPMVVNGLETVTNPISGSQMFYRLSQ